MTSNIIPKSPIEMSTAELWEEAKGYLLDERIPPRFVLLDIVWKIRRGEALSLPDRFLKK